MADDLLEDFEPGEDGNDPTEEIPGAEDKPKRALLAMLSRLKLKRPGKKGLIIIAGVVVLLVVILGALFLFFSGKEADAPVDSGTPAPVQDGAAPDGTVPARVHFEDIVELPPFERIALKRGSHLPNISLKISLELADPKFRKQVVTLEEKLGKIVTDELRERVWFELRNPEGKIRLKYELIARMNKIFPRVTIRNIYFTQFLMQ